jgi:hypothetical protein
MTSFQFDIGGRARKSGRFVQHVRTELLKIASLREQTQGVTPQAVAERLQIERAEVDRQLSGEQPLTLGNIADLAWALGAEVIVAIREDRSDRCGAAEMPTSTVGLRPIKVVALSSALTN